MYNASYYVYFAYFGVRDITQRKYLKYLKPYPRFKNHRLQPVVFMMQIPSMEERLGRIVTAPTATSSSWWIGLLLEPQLSDPIHRKWPTWLALLVALRTPLQEHPYGY